MSELFEDVYARETGTCSAYEKAYAQRVNFPKNSMTTTEQNWGNNFQAFERMHMSILITQFRDLLVNLFRYDNLPPTLNGLQIEVMLRQSGGGVCVGLDDLGDLVVLGRTDSLGYNVYGNVIPTFLDNQNNFLINKRQVTHRSLSKPKGQQGDFVVFYNKASYADFFSTDFEILDHYVNYLATIRATERMNTLQMRAPYLIRTKKGSIEAKILKQILFGGELVFEIDDDSNLPDRLSKLDLNVTDRTASLQNTYRTVMNEMLTLFGIYNNPESKKERLIDKEASSNNHVIESMGDIYFNARRDAVDLLNQRFDLDIKVEWNSTIATAFKNMANSKELRI